MFLLKSGAIRLFMKRGNSDVEIDTVRSGQVLGELAFLDGNPRSVSGEALMDSELLEISGTTFGDTLIQAPEWLKILLKTIVSRLRIATGKIRHLEAANVSLVYSVKEGISRGSTYQYLSEAEFIKIGTSILLACSRNGTQIANGAEVELGQIDFFARQIQGIPAAKTSSAINLLADSGVLLMREVPGVGLRVGLKDAPLLVHTITQLVSDDQQWKKKGELSDCALFMMGIVAERISAEKLGDQTDAIKLELKISQDALGTETTEVFSKLDELTKLVGMGFLLAHEVASSGEGSVTVVPQKFIEDYILMKMIVGLRQLNQQKQETLNRSRR